MKKFGIPPLLIGIVNATCFNTRIAEFSGKGVLSNFGVSIGEIDRQIEIVNGIMMGDPLTKVILHLINLCVRHSAGILVKGNINCFSNAAQLSETLLWLHNI